MDYYHYTIYGLTWSHFTEYKEIIVDAEQFYMELIFAGTREVACERWRIFAPITDDTWSAFASYEVE